MNSVSHTSNHHETSVTVLRSDSTKIDFCHIDQEIIIGETQGESHTQIVLSLQEARALASHLATILVG